MNSEVRQLVRTTVVVTTLFAIAGACGSRLAAAAWRLRAMPASDGPGLATVPAELPPRMRLLALGGFRRIVADVLWLRAHLAWERRDARRMAARLDAVVAVDPRPRVFWLSGARILAFDLPAWTGGNPDHAASAADAAVQWLARARQVHGDDPGWAIEEGNIHLHRRHDLEAATAAYGRAARAPGAPYYAGRIYAELLRRLGRHRDAYAWLTELHPRLDQAHDRLERERALPEIVLGRIRELEDLLQIPPGERYAPADAK